MLKGLISQLFNVCQAMYAICVYGCLRGCMNWRVQALALHVLPCICSCMYVHVNACMDSMCSIRSMLGGIIFHRKLVGHRGRYIAPGDTYDTGRMASWDCKRQHVTGFEYSFSNSPGKYQKTKDSQCVGSETWITVFYFEPKDGNNPAHHLPAGQSNER